MDFMGGFPRADVRGQATVFAVILLLAVVVGIGVLYNTGRLTLDKTRLQNTADSAAYSSGVLLARSYNFSAYANRAMVANQVVIAQMVGLRSWSDYYCLDYHDSCKVGDQTIESSNDLPGSIGDMLKGNPEYIPWKIYQGISEVNLIPNAVDVKIATAANKINKKLSQASSTYQDAVLADLKAATTQTGLVHTIIKANYPHLASSDRPYLGTIGQGLWLTDLAQAKAYTQLYGSNNPQHMQMVATIVQNSLDKWTRERMSSGGLSNSETLPFPMVNVEAAEKLAACQSPSWMLLWVSYHGSTQWQWQGNNPNWSATDQAHIYGFTSWAFPDPVTGGCTVIPFVPITATNPSIWFWADQLSKARAEYGKQTSHGGFPKGPLLGYAGLEPYEDVSQQNLSTTAAPILSLDLVRKHNTIATTQQLQVDQGKNKVGIGATNRLNLPSKEAHGEMAALATVQVHFVRPGGAGHQRLLGTDIEYGTLFNPYWEAHLVPTPHKTQKTVQQEQEKR